MFTRPSSRRKSMKEPIPINLVPMLDALITLITFLLFSATFLQFVSIDSPLPLVSKKQTEEQLKDPPLQLSLTITPQNVELWSPFNRIAKSVIPSLPDGSPDLNQLHDAIVGIKSRFPNDKTIIMLPDSNVSYDTLVAVMDAVKLLEPTDPPIFVKDEQGMDRQLKTLFPDIVYGNLLGG